MLVVAMEVSGIEGTYRLTCETVMNVLRRNSESILAVLEAFVYDPLIDWFTKGQTHRGRSELYRGGREPFGRWLMRLVLVRAGCRRDNGCARYRISVGLGQWLGQCGIFRSTGDTTVRCMGTLVLRFVCLCVAGP